MSSALRVKTATRRAANLSINAQLLAEAKALQVNLSKAAEQGLVMAIAQKRSEIWRQENEDALESSNAYVEKHGLPLAKHRQF